MTTATAPTVVVEPEALAYADEVGMRAALEHMLAATPRLVPGLRSIHVWLKKDWDEPERRNFRFDVRMERTTKEVFLKADRDWSMEFVTIIRDHPRPRPTFLFMLEREAE